MRFLLSIAGVLMMVSCDRPVQLDKLCCSPCSPVDPRCTGFDLRVNLTGFLESNGAIAHVGLTDAAGQRIAYQNATIENGDIDVRIPDVLSSNLTLFWLVENVESNNNFADPDEKRFKLPFGTITNNVSVSHDTSNSTFVTVPVDEINRLLLQQN